MDLDTYCDVHRSFLQSCLSRGWMKKLEAIRLLEHIFAKYKLNQQPNNADLENIIQSINEKIRPFDQKIVQITFDQLNDTFIVFCITAENDITKLQIIYSETEVEFFRLLLKEIVINENNFTNSTDALNLADQIKGIPKLPKSRAEELLHKWNCEGYFFETGNQIFYGPRAVAEFTTYLQHNYADFVKNCKLCILPVFVGIGCGGGGSANGCNGNFHKSCLKKYIESNNLNCPQCKNKINIQNCPEK